EAVQLEPVVVDRDHGPGDVRGDAHDLGLLHERLPLLGTLRRFPAPAGVRGQPFREPAGVGDERQGVRNRGRDDLLGVGARRPLRQALRRDVTGGLGLRRRLGVAGIGRSRRSTEHPAEEFPAQAWIGGGGPYQPPSASHLGTNLAQRVAHRPSTYRPFGMYVGALWLTEAYRDTFLRPTSAGAACPTRITSARPR